jgi:hypothetical protein
MHKNQLAAFTSLDYVNLFLTWVINLFVLILAIPLIIFLLPFVLLFSKNMDTDYEGY